MISVIWQAYSSERSGRLFGTQIFLNDILLQNFDPNYFDDFQDFFKLKNGEGAVVVISLDHNEDYIEQLNTDINKLPWCLLIITSNEYASKSYKKLSHPNMKVWIQSASEDDVADKFIGFGYPSKVINENQERTLDWFFAGQITHDRRREWSKELDQIPNGRFVASSGFNKGLDFKEYEKYLNRAKIVPCPAGPETPDTFRLYEALEAGCIPIVDAYDGRGNKRTDYWEKVFTDFPCIIVSETSSLEEAIRHELDNYDERVQTIKSWWTDEKQRFIDDLDNDIKTLRKNK